MKCVSVLSIFIFICIPSLLHSMDKKLLITPSKNSHQKIYLEESIVACSDYLMVQKEQLRTTRKKKKKPLIAHTSPTQIQLFKEAIGALKKGFGDFKLHCDTLQEKNCLNGLIRVAGDLMSSQLTAYLVDYYFPSEVAQTIASYIKPAFIEKVRYEIIKKNCALLQSNKFVFDETMITNISYQLFLNDHMNDGESLKNNTYHFVCPQKKNNCFICSEKMNFACHKNPVLGHYWNAQQDKFITHSSHPSGSNHIVIWEVNFYKNSSIMYQKKEIKRGGTIIKIEFSPTGDTFIIVFADGTFALYASETGKQIGKKGVYNVLKHQQKKRYKQRFQDKEQYCVPNIEFSTDGRLLLITNGEKSANVSSSFVSSLWDVEACDKLLDLKKAHTVLQDGYFFWNDRIINLWKLEKEKLCEQTDVTTNQLDEKQINYIYLSAQKNRSELCYLSKNYRPGAIDIYDLYSRIKNQKGIEGICAEERLQKALIHSFTYLS